MDPKLYYTKDELYNLPHTRFIETENNVMFTSSDDIFHYYKKLYLLKKDASDVTEIYVGIKSYLVIKDYLDHSISRWMNEFNAYVFYSITDYIRCLDEANKNRLF